MNFFGACVAENYFGNGSVDLQQQPDRVLPAKYVSGYTAEAATQKLYDRVRREAGYKGKTAQIPVEIIDD